MAANIVITGASKGMGLATALAFAREGCNVAICARSAASLTAAFAELKAVNLQGHFLASQVDITDKSQLLRFANEVKEAFGNVDVLINNAGTFIPGSIREEPEGTFETMMGINLTGAYHFTRMILPDMVARRQGHIFNVCSTASITAYTNGGSYCISKFALYGMTKVLREELKPHNIRVTAVLPGATLTDSWAGTPLPPERFIDVNDIADSIVHAWKMKPSSVVEEILIRPQLGDII